MTKEVELLRGLTGTLTVQVEHGRLRHDAVDQRRRSVCPELVTTGVGGADTAMLVTRPSAGHTARRLPPEQIDDTVLRAAWTELGRLHDAGVSHGNLEPSRVLVVRRRRRVRRPQRRRGAPRVVLVRP